MAKKHQHRAFGVHTQESLPDRVRRAMQEGRSQHALDLAKQLAKQEPTPAHQELLRQAYLGRVRQLRQQGHTRDARAVLEHMAQLGHREPAWLEQLAAELAACGDGRRALELTQGLADPQAQGRILGPAVDAAVQQKAAGRASLPENLREQFDLVLQAFQQLEAGQDEAVRLTLQGIGLQSPFLDWKLFLRGLQAYFLKDDERALENWGRLNPQRLPARLAAPFRAQLDSAFRLAQPPETQVALQRQLERLQGSAGLVASLRSIQTALHREQIPQAFRLAEGVLPQLRKEAPQLVPRLAACFQSVIVRAGDQPDLARYKRLFGAPPDDPDLNRLEALALERCEILEDAHKFWQKYEKSVAAHPETWPPGHAAKVRALIWWHMGKNAEAGGPDEEQLKTLPPFLRNHPDRPKPLNPSAEKCFQRSLELDPEQLEPYTALFEHYRHRQQQAKAEKAAHQLLQRFPEHLPTLEHLGDLLLAEKPAEAIGFLQKAFHINPLSRSLQEKLVTAQSTQARSLAEAKDFAAARAAYQAALACSGGRPRFSLYCKWATCEFKAGQSAYAEELIEKARATAGTVLPVAHLLLIEAIRYKVPAALKKRFDQEFTAALAEPATAAGVVAALETAAAYRKAGVKYTGQKTHEKKLLTLYAQVPAATFSETQLLAVGEAFVALGEMAQVKKLVQVGRRQFPRNPLFVLLEADTLLLPKPKVRQAYTLHRLIAEARRLAQELPAGEQAEVSGKIEQREAAALAAGLRGGPGALGFLQNMFGGMPNPFGGSFADPFGSDDDEFESSW